MYASIRKRRNLSVLRDMVDSSYYLPEGRVTRKNRNGRPRSDYDLQRTV